MSFIAEQLGSPFYRQYQMSLVFGALEVVLSQVGGGVQAAGAELCQRSVGPPCPTHCALVRAAASPSPTSCPTWSTCGGSP